jgi:hypothetical protein
MNFRKLLVKEVNKAGTCSATLPRTTKHGKSFKVKIVRIAFCAKSWLGLFINPAFNISVREFLFWHTKRRSNN